MGIYLPLLGWQRASRWHLRTISVQEASGTSPSQSEGGTLLQLGAAEADHRPHVSGCPGCAVRSITAVLRLHGCTGSRQSAGLWLSGCTARPAPYFLILCGRHCARAGPCTAAVTSDTISATDWPLSMCPCPPASARCRMSMRSCTFHTAAHIGFTGSD